MKSLIKVFIIMLSLSASNLYALDYDTTDKDNQEEYVETSTLEEKQTYDVDMRPYINFKYTSSKKETKH